MTALRACQQRHRVWAMWLIAAALLTRFAVPSGYMPVFSAGGVKIELCTGFGPAKAAMAMPGMADPRAGDRADKSDKRATPCWFADHALGSTPAVDPVLLLAAIALIVGAPPPRLASWPVRRADFLLPPSRAPPAGS